MEENKTPTEEASVETSTERTESHEAPHTHTETTPVFAENKTDVKKMVLGGLIAALLIGGGGYFVYSGASLPFFEEEVVEDPGFVDEAMVVATVNDNEIYGKALNLQMVRVVQVSGGPTIEEVPEASRINLRNQSLDAIINTELIVQVATDFGISVTGEDVETEYQSIVETFGGAESAEARLTELGTTVEEFKEGLVNDILIARYLEATTEASLLEVTEEEIVSTYTLMTGGQTENVPSLEALRPQIEAQLTFNKQQESLLAVLEQLREEAEIEKFI